MLIHDGGIGATWLEGLLGGGGCVDDEGSENATKVSKGVDCWQKKYHFDTDEVTNDLIIGNKGCGWCGLYAGLE
jgi:hypothetical protein